MARSVPWWLLAGLGLCLLAGCRVPRVTLAPPRPTPSWGCLYMGPRGLTWASPTDPATLRVVEAFPADQASTTAAVSRDGRNLAVLSARNALLVIALSTGARQQIGEPLAAGDARQEMVWSPDGKTLAFVENRDLWLWDARGGRRQLVDSGDVSSLGWSPDGRLLAYGCRDTTDKDRGLWLVPAAGGKPRQLVKGVNDIFAASFPTFSPDGQWIAFCHAWEGGALAFVKVDGTGYRQGLGPGWLPLRWLPDSSALLYEALEDEITSRGLWRCTPAGQPEPVVETGVNGFDMLPDGALCWVQATGKVDDQLNHLVLKLRPAGAGGTDATVALPDGTYGECHWRPDGRQIAVWMGGREGEQSLLAGPPTGPMATVAASVGNFIGWGVAPPPPPTDK